MASSQSSVITQEKKTLFSPSLLQILHGLHVCRSGHVTHLKLNTHEHILDFLHSIYRI